MIVTLEEMKQYLRVDYEDEDSLIETLLKVAQQMCMDVMRTEDAEEFSKAENAKAAVMYSTAYLYEHREEADHHGLILTLRSLLFGNRREAF